MKKNNSMNELTKKIIYAVTRYALEVKKTNKVNIVIAELINQTPKTATNRCNDNSWSFEEVIAIAQTTKDTELISYYHKQL
jgi:hypothetical protein